MKEMEERKGFRAKPYLAALVLTIIVFAMGIWLGNYLTNAKFSSLSSLENDFARQTLGAELQFQILSEDPCAAVQSDALTSQLYEIDTKLTSLENQLGFDDPTVRALKEDYSLAGVRHWLLLRKAKDSCNINKTLILFFYSNEGDCKNCEQQGSVLSYLRKKYDDINVYAFDTNLANPAIEGLKQRFLLNGRTPALVIDDRVIYGYYDAEELKRIIDGKSIVMVESTQ